MSEKEVEKVEDVDFSPEESDQIDEMLEGVMNDVLNKGLTPGQILNISKEETDALYVLGHSHYAEGDYDKAEDAFTLLCRLSPLETEYLRALGSTFQMKKKYQEAINAFGAAIAIDIEDAEASLHAAECLLHIGKRKEAKEALEGCQMQCKEDKEKYAETLVKANNLLKTLDEDGAEEEK